MLGKLRLLKHPWAKLVILELLLHSIDVLLIGSIRIAQENDPAEIGLKV